MSSLTQCCYCGLQTIKRRAKKENKRVVLKPSSFLGGTEVFLVPKGEKLPLYREPSKKEPDGDAVYQKFNVGWMMQISSECCC